MKPNFLPVAIKNAGVALEDVLPQVLKAPPTRKYYLHVCLLYRRLAVGSLLASSDPTPFYASLFKSSRAFLHFLKMAPDSEKVTSKSEPFFDAIACRDQEGARAIAKASPAALVPNREYEEDFLYVRFLMERFFLGASPATLRKMLDRYTQLVDGNPDVHLDLCRALLVQDQALFDEALGTAIAERLAYYKAKRDEETLNPDDAATLAHVSTEVLAWLELAEQAGLKVARNYKLAPRVARLFTQVRFPASDAWKSAESFRSLPRRKGP